jgi:hypothetical protein
MTMRDKANECFADGYYGTLKMPSNGLLIPLTLVLE